MSSIVLDTCVMRLYNAPLDPKYQELFSWLTESGSLYVSHKLITEYIGTGNQKISILLSHLTRHSDSKRLIQIPTSKIKNFNKDKHYNYTCNEEDHLHARLVFLSPRKKLLTQDKKLDYDVNNFKKIDGIQPESRTKKFDENFYKN